MPISARICYSVLLVILISVPAGSSQTIQPVEQLMVVDGNGKRVGLVLGVGSTVIVGFKVDRIPIVLAVYRTFFQGHAVYWESTDCSGTPLLPSGGVGLFPPAGVSFPGNTVFVPVPNGEERTATVRSRADTRECSSIDFPFPFQIKVVPARALLNLDNHFTPPFSLR